MRVHPGQRQRRGHGRRHIHQPGPALDDCAGTDHAGGDEHDVGERAHQHHRAHPLRFDIHRDDEEHIAALLRTGTVVVAITTDPGPVAGCSVTRPGDLRYRPMAAAAWTRRWLPDGPTAQGLAHAPVVVFDREDDLQHRYLRARLPGPAEPPTHYVPSSADFLTAIRLGMGWGMLPDLQSHCAEASGHRVDIDRSGAIGVALHWQQWKLRSPSLDRVAAAVIVAARHHLAQSGARAFRAWPRARARWCRPAGRR